MIKQVNHRRTRAYTAFLNLARALGKNYDPQAYNFKDCWMMESEKGVYRVVALNSSGGRTMPFGNWKPMDEFVTMLSGGYVVATLPSDKKSEPSWYDKAKDDAADTAENFIDNIIEALFDKSEAGDDLNNDYPGGDEYHHSYHTDKSYGFDEAVKILDDLDDYEETDSGLWEGQDFKQALQTCAAYTYSGAVHAKFRELIEDINSEYDLSSFDDEIREEFVKAGKLKEDDDDTDVSEVEGYEEAKKAKIKALVEQRIERYRPE